MPFNRTSSYVAIGLLLCLLATPSLGQGPLGFQIFAPADVSTYGGVQEPNEGYFFQFDGLYWSISAPEVRTVGAPGTRKVFYGTGGINVNDPTQQKNSPTATGNDFRIESNTLDTSGFGDKFSAGNRIEFGRMENRNGWLVSIYQQRDQTQAYIVPQADIVFNDPAFGANGETLLQGNVNNDGSTTPPYSPPVFRNLPVVFQNVLVENALDTWGVEANYLHRFMTSQSGGTFELLLGARYFEFNDNFYVHTAVNPNALTQPFFDATNGTTVNVNVPSFLGGSYWDTSAENHVVGPQIGLRWFKKQGRWTFSTEGRFMAGLNCQNISQEVDMGPSLDPGPKTVVTRTLVPQTGTQTGTPIYHYQSYYIYQPFQPTVMSHTTATHVEYEREWSPALELRVEGRYQITRAISFHAGWTGFWMDGIARASSMINYTVPAMGIDMDGNRQGLFVNGLTLGFDVNR